MKILQGSAAQQAVRNGGDGKDSNPFFGWTRRGTAHLEVKIRRFNYIDPTVPR